MQSTLTSLESLRDWGLPELRSLLPSLDDAERCNILAFSTVQHVQPATQQLQNLLGHSPQAVDFAAKYVDWRTNFRQGKPAPEWEVRDCIERWAGQSSPPPHVSRPGRDPVNAGPAPGSGMASPAGNQHQQLDELPSYAPSPGPMMAPQAVPTPSYIPTHHHTNPVIAAGHLRARDEQEIQQMLQDIQFEFGIYNSEIDPEHETDYMCSCRIHQYQQRKWSRLRAQEAWCAAVMYPGEKFYTDIPWGSAMLSTNPYVWNLPCTPYGYRGQGQSNWTLRPRRPSPRYHRDWIEATIALNNRLNQEAQEKVDRKEPLESIWVLDNAERRLDMEAAKATDTKLDKAMGGMTLAEPKRTPGFGDENEDEVGPNDSEQIDNKADKVTSNTSGEALTSSRSQKRLSIFRQGNKHQDNVGASSSKDSGQPKPSKLAGFRKALGIQSSAAKAADKANDLRVAILAEEASRWPNAPWRELVASYQSKVGMASHIAALRAHKPIQYLHLLRAGYFEPIPVAWATAASNPLKFMVEPAAGWRGVTPAWRGYEDLAEERLYWVLNHREGGPGSMGRMKPDFISEMNMARQRMARAVEPPPSYFSEHDVCVEQRTTMGGYSKQVMPPPFRPFDRPETAADDTMILLDVSGSMDFKPVQPVYDQYLVTQWANSAQPKNKDVAKAIIRRFTDALCNHHHSQQGYDLVTFSSRAQVLGRINHANLDGVWASRVHFGGGTRVMTGWQLVKEMHFQKHSASATHHPTFGWIAGPETPILRLLLLLDGEATDMDEFELDLLGLSWAHVTIFLIGVDGCPHHHRHANELQRISEVNHHVSFVDAQGNFAERFVTHELLKRHLGWDVSMQEFQAWEGLPAYQEAGGL